jgi:hypothetical protein
MVSVSAWAQEVELQGRVVDAETGEALPYVSIYVKEGKGALTNADGEFMLCVSKEDILTFSYVSYEKRRIIASEVPKVVRLKAFERMLSEVVVKPVNERKVLKQVMRNLKQDYKIHKEERQGYYLRALMKNSKDSYLVESLMAGLSAVNLRNAETLSGRSGLNAKGDESEMKLRLTNIHHLAELGARTYQSAYWESVIKPLTSMAMIKKYYKVEMETLHGSDGEKLYRYTFQWNNKHTRDIGQRRYLTGTIDVDAKNLRMLRFEGNVGNAYQWVNFQRTPTTIKFHMSYDYSRGYAAVSNIAVEGGNDRMKYRTLLFDIPDDDLFAKSSGYSGGNILYSVDVAGYDSTLWERYDIVKRTKEEEIAAFGDEE